MGNHGAVGGISERRHSSSSLSNYLILLVPVVAIFLSIYFLIILLEYGNVLL